MGDSAPFLRKQPHWDHEHVNNPDGCCSSDAVQVYNDGQAFCYSCNKQLFPRSDHYNYFDWLEGREPGDPKEDSHMTPQVTPQRNQRDDLGIELHAYESAMYKSFPDRNIDIYTSQKFGVKTDGNGNVYFPYYSRSKQSICGFKIRTPDKDFRSVGKVVGEDVMLFGQQLFKGGGKYITIHEGEFDAMAGYIMMGSQYANLSIPTGAKGAQKATRLNIDYLETYDKKVLSFDGDKPGQEAIELVAPLFMPGTCQVIRHTEDLKDACEYTKANMGGVFMKAFWNAKVYTPSGIVNLADEGLDALYNRPERASIPYGWEGLDQKTKGLRKKELVTLCSGSGMGKSAITREISKLLLDSSEDNIGLLYLEEDLDRTKLGVMGMYADRPLHLEDVFRETPREIVQEAYDQSIGTGRLIAFNHFGSTSVEDILNRVRYMIVGLQCDWVILDHLSIIVSGIEGEDERKCIDLAMTKLRTLVEETGAGLILVSHLKRVQGDKGHEDGAKVSLSHLRGSQAIAQLSDIVIALERNQQETDPIKANTTVLRVLKNRYTGDVGEACRLYFDKQTGRMSHVCKELEDFIDDDLSEF